MDPLHDDEHRAWLRALACGDVDPLSPESAARLSSCARCRAEWEAIGPLRARLDELARPPEAEGGGPSRPSPAAG